jgi:prevent-host-death family protein
MAVFSSSDWNRKSGDIFEAARKGPVTITQRKRPSFVVLSYDSFQKLSQFESRRYYTLDTLPDDIFAQAELELKKLEADGEH